MKCDSIANQTLPHNEKMKIPNISWVKDTKPYSEFFHQVCLGVDKKNNLKVSIPVQQIYCQTGFHLV
jgi:hypothetical protein